MFKRQVLKSGFSESDSEDKTEIAATISEDYWLQSLCHLLFYIKV